jgi:Activator of Hsp90 ATPase homolog 1-like protein
MQSSNLAKGVQKLMKSVQQKPERQSGWPACLFQSSHEVLSGRENLPAAAIDAQTGRRNVAMQEWQLNSVVEVFVDASVERLWAALTEPTDTEQYSMRSRVTVGDVGEAYRLEREDGWKVDGIVLAKEPPYRLRSPGGRRRRLIR